MDICNIIGKMAYKAAKLADSDKSIHWYIFKLCQRDIQDRPVIIN